VRPLTDNVAVGPTIGVPRVPVMPDRGLTVLIQEESSKRLVYDNKGC
jgi:hypothetical protein